MDVTGLGAVADLASSVINRIWPDATESDKQKMALALAQLQSQTDLLKGQLEINKAEAASPSLFVSGWRPAIGWCFPIILLYSYVIFPVITFGIALADVNIVPPKLSIDDNLWQLLLGMFGMYASRSFEKIKGMK